MKTDEQLAQEAYTIHEHGQATELEAAMREQGMGHLVDGPLKEMKNIFSWENIPECEKKVWRDVVVYFKEALSS